MKLNANFFSHHKTRKLDKTLGNDGIVSLIKLWGYAEQFRKNGALSNMKEQDIELVSEWNGDTGLFVYALVDIGFLDEHDGVFALHDWADWNEEKPPLIGEMPRSGGEVIPSPTFPPHEECDYQVDLESCDDSDEYAALIRKGIEVIPVDIFNTGKSADELRKEHMGKHYDDYNAMMARTRGGTG